MRRFSTTALLLLLAPWAAAVAQGPPIPSDSRQPARDFRAQPLEYAGPGRTEPGALEEVLLGWFGPSDPDHPLHGDLWVAASLAVERANAEGGYVGVPFRLLPAWSENPWGTGVAQVFRQVYEQGVRAILGGVDGPSTHLAEQVTAKARLPLVSPVATDLSVNLAGVPWMFSLAPADHLWAPAVAEGLLAAVGERYFVLLAGTDHDSRMAARELSAILAAEDRGPALRLDVETGVVDPDRLMAPLADFEPAAFLLVNGISESATLLNELRRRGFEQPVFGTPHMARRAFRRQLEVPPGEVWVPRMAAENVDSEERQRFVGAFRERTGADPDWAALSSYDAALLLIEAVRRGGLDPATIREALLQLSPWPGLAGTVEWDPTGQNLRPVEDLVAAADLENQVSREPYEP